MFFNARTSVRVAQPSYILPATFSTKDFMVYEKPQCVVMRATLTTYSPTTHAFRKAVHSRPGVHAHAHAQIFNLFIINQPPSCSCIMVDSDDQSHLIHSNSSAQPTHSPDHDVLHLVDHRHVVHLDRGTLLSGIPDSSHLCRLIL